MHQLMLKCVGCLLSTLKMELISIGVKIAPSNDFIQIKMFKIL